MEIENMVRIEISGEQGSGRVIVMEVIAQELMKKGFTFVLGEDDIGNYELNVDAKNYKLIGVQ